MWVLIIFGEGGVVLKKAWVRGRREDTLAS
jgi:hypothetical protein